MFGFLKNKLREAINKFSNKVETKVDETIKKEEIKTEIVKEKEEKGFLGLFKKKEKIEEPIEEITKKESIKEESKLVEEKGLQEEKGFFAKITEKLTTKKIDEKEFDELFNDLELVLLENNVALEVIDKIKEDLKVDLVNVPLKGKINDLIKNSLRDSLEDLLKETNFDLIQEIKNKKEKPYIMVFVGLNGSGKTTTIAKLAHLLKENKLKCILVAGDTWRKAAIEQLEEHSKKLDIKIVKHSYESDPTSVAFDGVKMAKAHDFDVVLIDTAGRQHSNKNLIEEMKKIVRIIKPDLKIFVGESISGNDLILQVQEFDKAINLDSIILAKTDVDEKGGAIISATYVTRKPIIYLGSGQTYNDLEKFDKNKIIKSLNL